MASVSGLSAEHRYEARQMAKNAALLGWKNRYTVHYTQGNMRWQGINHDLKAWQGEYPNYADCSAYTTWCLWNGLSHFGVRDTVNGLNWRYGYTGTQVNHGKRVRLAANYLTGDLVFYGWRGVTHHVAIMVDPKHKIVVSHGSEGGPFLLNMNYRRDFMQVRRYI